MEVSTALSSTPQFEPDIEVIKLRLINNGIYPTPKIIRTLQKKQFLKHKRKQTKIAQTLQPPPLTPSQKRALAEDSHFQTVKSEYRDLSKAVKAEESRSASSGLLVGRPWEMIEKVKLREIASGSKEFNGDRLKMEKLGELKEIFEDGLKWVLDNDIEIEEESDDWLRSGNQRQWDPTKRRCSDKQAIRFLVDRLSSRNVTVKDWKLAKIMKQSGLQFSEGLLMKIVEGLGDNGKSEQAMAVVEWVYNDKELRDCRSRFVYTKLLSVLRKGGRPQAALTIFNLMREDCSIYPDMAAYHIIAVALGQAGMLKELLKIIECMRQKPSKRIYNRYNKNWDPVLEPDMVVYNAVLNACIPIKQWKGVSWVFEQLRKGGLKPNGATYGLAMEVMLNSGKYDLVHELFRKMNRRGESPKALTYKILVKAFWQEGKVNEAVKAVRDMEQRGVVGNASVYYELARCLCSSGRWRDALLEVNKVKGLRSTKPLEVTFTGMIMSSLDGGHVSDCISIFEYMKGYCVPNIGTINIMLKVYGQNDLFSKAKELFEEIKGAKNENCLAPDAFTYSAMLEASASALQWEYFELVYREMVLSGYQLVQSKHALLLVEVSRAGKGHLLEHAFDAALEAGEIPHQLLFIEMVFQATAQQNYERAVNLVNTMAYAPFQISERQWVDLFTKNRGKISRDSLKKLLDALGNSNVSSEPTTVNLSRTLLSQCRSVASDKQCLPEVSGVDETEITSVEHCSSVEEGSDDTDVVPTLKTDGLASGEEVGSDGYEIEYGMGIKEVDDDDDDVCASKLPSANEILSSWKESRNSGIFRNLSNNKVVDLSIN